VSQVVLEAEAVAGERFRQRWCAACGGPVEPGSVSLIPTTTGWAGVLAWHEPCGTVLPLRPYAAATDRGEIQE
jgi:hypothetical protein